MSMRIFVVGGASVEILVESRMKLEGGKAESVGMSTSKDRAVLRVENVWMSSSYERLSVAMGCDGLCDSRSLTDEIRVQRGIDGGHLDYTWGGEEGRLNKYVDCRFI
uniref:Uncharacterized protein n=1 Tax=Photinus pyralis TaxID=7054 RepID=A0A1Y1LIJ1_PHOPY